MRRLLTLSRLLLPLAIVAGCRHQPAPSPAPVATAPPLPASSMTHVQDLPPVPPPTETKVGPPGSDQTAQETKPAPPPHRARRPKKKVVSADSTMASAPAPSAASGSQASAATSATATPASSTQAALGPPVAAAPAPEPTLGQLSAGGAADSKERAAMVDEIHSQEVRLSAIKRPLNNESEAITLQVRVFLTKARQAAQENDLDGARTLTMKAKVLLDELSNS